MRGEVLLVTGSRADWGLLRSVARRIDEAEGLSLALLATGSHLDPRYGETASEILADGFEIHERVPILSDGDGSREAAAALAKAADGVAGVLERRKPALMLVLGDRYEILGAVSAALLMRVPVAHLCGGDVTGGAFDDQIRHAITKMAHLHFPSNMVSADRIVQMGESPDRVYTVGSPGLDNLSDFMPPARASFLRDVGLPADKPFLMVTFHPATLDPMPGVTQFEELAAALAGMLDDLSVLFTGTNADPEGSKLNAAARAFADTHDGAVFHDSLGHERYFAALSHAAAVVGNSSSGLYEAPSLGLPTVNIGMRQEGRLRAASVIDCPAERSAIRNAIDKALAFDMRGVTNPYGDGKTAERIVEILKGVENPGALLKKQFYVAEG